MTQTQANFKPTPKMIAAAEAVLFCMAAESQVKQIVDAYQRRILQEEQLHIDPKYIGRRGETDRIITEPNEVFLLSEKDMVWACDLFSWAAKDAGYDLPAGHCPALTANTNLVKAQQHLIDVMQPITGISRDSIWESSNALVNYNKLVDINLRFLTPFVRSTKQIITAAVVN